MRVLLAAALLVAGTAQAEVAVLTTGAFKPVVHAVAEPFQAATGEAVHVSNDTAGSVLRLVRAGTAADVVISTAPGLATMAREGLIVDDSRVDLARVGIGVAVRAGAPLPALATQAEFRAALQAARSVSIVDPAAGGTSGIYLTALFDRLGIGAEMAAKLVRVPGGLAAVRVADGTADMALQQASELGMPGVVVAGMLPAEVQSYSVYSGPVSAKAVNPEQARAFLRASGEAAAERAIVEKRMSRP